jgi:ABC-type polysaccharide/polyol phosphate export permease
MLKTILIIIISVAIFGIIVFSFVRQILKRHIDQLVEDEKILKKNKKK